MQSEKELTPEHTRSEPDATNSKESRWTSLTTDPRWAIGDSADRKWESTAPPSWEGLEHDSPHIWPSSGKHTSPKASDADLDAFLSMGKDQSHVDAESPDDPDQAHSYLDITESETWRDNVRKVGSQGDWESTMAASEPLISGIPWKAGDATFRKEDLTKPTTLNVAASPFLPSKPRAGSEEGVKLNPSAQPFVPTGQRAAVTEVSVGPARRDPAAPNGSEEAELARARLSVRHYQNLSISLKEELQTSTLNFQKEFEAARRLHEAFDQKCKEIDRLRSELLSEGLRSKQATEQLLALQGEMAQYRKLMEQLQAQIKLAWGDLLGQLHEERAARRQAEGQAAQAQAELHAARAGGALPGGGPSGDAEEEGQGQLREARALARKQQERAEAKEKEAQFYRTMYANAMKQVEVSQQVAREAIEMERQARREAEGLAGPPPAPAN